MIDYEYADRQFLDLSDRLLTPAFRKIAMTYCATQGEFYDALELFYVLLGVELDEADIKERLDKYRLRLIRLIDRFNIEKEDIRKAKNHIFFKEKVYDYKLHESMVEAYRNLAQALGDQYMETIPVNIWIRSIAVEDREGFSVVELTLLLCLFLSVQGRSVGKLNVSLESENEKKRAKLRFRKIKETLLSKEMLTILTYLILDLLADYHKKNYENNYYRHLRNFWLPERKRHLKTAQYAVQRYGNRITKAYYTESDMDALNAAEKIQLLTENGDIARIQQLFFVIQPIVTAYVDGTLPLNLCELAQQESISCGAAERPIAINMRDFLLASNAVSEETKNHIRSMPPTYYEATIEDYWVARRVALAIREYARGVIKAVVTLLETLPEAQIAGEQGMWNYLLSI